MTKVAHHSERAPHDASGKFWKAMLHKTYEIVDKVSHTMYIVNSPKWSFLKINVIYAAGLFAKVSSVCRYMAKGTTSYVCV